MKFLEITEAIVNKPRDLKQFCASRSRMLIRISASVAQAYDFIHKCEKSNDYKDAEYVLDYALRNTSDDAARLHNLNSYSVNLEERYRIKDIADNLIAVEKFGAARFAQYVPSTIKYVRPIDEEAKKTLRAMKHIEQGFIDYGFSPATETDEDYLKARKLADAFLVILDLIEKLEKIIGNVNAVFKDILKRYDFNHNPHLYKPDHDEVEKLYHASLFAADIAANGFAAEKPIDRVGVGNFGHQREISFTHDIRIANDIVRTFKEMWMIVHGKITRNDVVRWIHADGIDLSLASSFYMSSKEPVTTVRQAFNLYRGWIGLNKIRSNPMIVNAEDLIPVLQKIDFSDIGIVYCDVRLDKDAKYMFGENEFRVTPDKIVGPVRLLP